jgi:TnpA family transposase
MIDILLKSVTSALHKTNNQQALQEQDIKEERNKAIQELSKSHKSISKLAKNIITVVDSKTATANEKYYKIEALVFDYQTNDEIDYSILEDLDHQILKESKKHSFYQILETLSLKLQRRVSPVIKVLVFERSSKATELLEAIDHFKNSDGNIGNNPPTDFLTSPDLSAVKTVEGFSISLYKCLLFIHTAKAIKAGHLNLAHSYRFRAIQDYLIDKDYWDKNKESILSHNGLLEYADGKAYLSTLKTELDKKYESVNNRFSKGKNPYLLIKDGRVSRVTTPKTDFEEKSFISSTLSEGGYIPILQLLKEVNQASNFTDCFKHLSPKNVKMKPREEMLMAGLIGKGCNIGLGKLASISEGISEHRLQNTVNWFFSIDNIRSANRKIVDAIHQLALANNYLHNADVIHSSSDGRKVNVAVDCLHANRSFKYFGNDKGVTIYTFIDETQSLFHSSVFSSSDREAPYVIDGLMANPVSEQKRIHSTDTHGYTEQIFAVSHFLGVAFAPRIKNIGAQRLYSFSARKTYYKKGYKILPSRPINKKLILEHWDDILRFIATIKTRHATASQLFKRLSSYAQDHPLYKALKEFGRVIKSQFILSYYDDLELRQQIQKQLNRIELSNKFSHAVFFDNDQAFQDGGLEEQEAMVACKLLLQNAIILWNYLYLSELVANTTDMDERLDLVNSISSASILNWKHVNLRGEYNFRKKAANDSRFDMDKIWALKLN